jgi:hypothetical protein
MQRGDIDQSDFDPRRVDHHAIDDHQLAERYVLGTLSEGEAELFEEHYLSCEECLERLEAAQGLAQGVRALAAEEAMVRVVTLQASFLSRWARLARSRAVPWALSTLLMVLLVPLYQGRVQRAALEERLQGAEARVVEASRSVAAEVDRQVAAAIADERQAQEQALAAERVEKEELAQRLAEARSPRLNTPIVSLSPPRSASAAPAVRLSLEEAPAWIVFALEAPPSPRARLRARLQAPGGAVLWQSPEFEPGPGGQVTLSLPTHLLADRGTFVLTLESRAPGGGFRPAGEYPLEVRR